ncbi:MAG: hypothetical protein GY738_23055 [Pseudoalteromonas sp.]|nr:hypothetical protein [Pseudoalteromonas sp.]
MTNKQQKLGMRPLPSPKVLLSWPHPYSRGKCIFLLSRNGEVLGWKAEKGGKPFRPEPVLFYFWALERRPSPFVERRNRLLLLDYG